MTTFEAMQAAMRGERVRNNQCSVGVSLVYKNGVFVWETLTGNSNSTPEVHLNDLTWKIVLDPDYTPNHDFKWAMEQLEKGKSVTCDEYRTTLGADFWKSRSIAQKWNVGELTSKMWRLADSTNVATREIILIS
jgi:hypothetical protein